MRGARSEDALAMEADRRALMVSGIVLVGSAWIARAGVPAWESSLFGAVNGLPDWLATPLWPFQQVGNAFGGVVVAAVAWAVHRRRLASAVLAATVAKLLTERLVKLVVERARPASSIGASAIVRGDVPERGLSFVSGHLVMVCALAWILAPLATRREQIGLVLLCALVGFGRVYVGAHNVLDVVGGAALGIGIGAALNMALAPVSGARR